MPTHPIPDVSPGPPLERIRDSTVAESVASAAGTEDAPDLKLSNLVTPVVVLPQRPPLASSGYFPGTIGATSAAVALNISQVGIFGSGVGRAIVRVNWILITNKEGTARGYNIRRVDSPFVDFPSVRAVPGYINAGLTATGGVFSVTRSDETSAEGALMANVTVFAADHLFIPGPWILNDGILLVAHGTVDKEVRAAFGYEVWPAIRVQAQG